MPVQKDMRDYTMEYKAGKVHNEMKKTVPLLFILFLPLSWAASPIGSVYRWIILGLFAFHIMKSGPMLRVDRTFARGFLVMSGLVAYMLLSVAWGSSMGEGIKNAMGFSLMYLVAIVFSSYNYGQVSLRKRLDQCWIAVGIICSILFLFGDRAKIGVYGSRTSLRILGTSTDPNEFAGLFSIIVAINIYYVLSSRGKERLINAVAVAVELYVVLLSGSRGAMIACVFSIGATALMFVQKRPGKIVLVTVAAVLLLTAFSKFIIPHIPLDLLKRMSIQTLFADGGGGRSTIWGNALHDFFSGNPLRVLFGYGANGLIVNGERGATATMHNYYLQLLTNFGIIGLCLYLVLFWSVVRRFWRLDRKYVPGLLAMAILALTLTTSPNYKPMWILMMTALIPKDHLIERKKGREK